jgi:protocatechuate 3,4-dioxygenase beta subunit
MGITQMNKSSRRLFIKTGLWGSTLAMFSHTSSASEPTPKEIKGPFYPLNAQKDRDFDLTQVAGKSGVAKGKVVFVEGRVLDSHDKPIENATVDIWQANAAGKYNHPHDTYDAPIDPNFQGWAIVQSGENGKFRFKTIIPGIYPATETWDRPPHIHFKVTKKGYVELVTQMYFPDHKLNTPDLLLAKKSKKQQAQMIATKIKGKQHSLRYNIVLKKA